MEKVVSVAGQ
jgi:hypothetical protein